MSRLYDTVEPAVVDDDMLKKCVHEQGPKYEAGKIAEKEGIEFSSVKHFRLDYKNILKIDNLWCFTSLTKLQMDNNIIEKIEGLDHLVQLRWLDLSFNNIEAIEGLDKLTQLEDLTLFNNRISKLENMSTLVNLQVFSIGNNTLNNLENLLYLRRFKLLRSFNVRGNLICDDEVFLPYVLAFLPQLVFLDYKLIDNAARTAAQEKYEMKTQEMEADERAAERKANEESRKAHELEHHKAAFVEFLNGSYLYESIYKDDSEGGKLNQMPAFEDKLEQFRQKMTESCEELFKFGLEDYVKRESEVSQFMECIDDVQNQNKKMSEDRIQEFMEYRKNVIEELMTVTDNKVSDEILNAYNNKVTELWDSLMGFELQLVDQLEDAIKEFDRTLEDMVSYFCENVATYFGQCRDHENNHNELVMEFAVSYLERVMKNELDEEPTDDLRALFVDKDTVVGAVQQSHDYHLLKIENREEDMVKRIKDWKSNIMNTLNNDVELKRNRTRVTEINTLIDHLRDEINNLDIPSMM